MSHHKINIKMKQNDLVEKKIKKLIVVVFEYQQKVGDT